MAPQRIPTHPGVFFRLDVLPKLKLEGEALTLAGVARLIGISKQYLHLVATGKTPMTAELAVLLCKLVGGNPRMFLAMQADHDLAKAERALARRLAKIPEADATPKPGNASVRAVAGKPGALVGKRGGLKVAVLDTRTRSIIPRQR